ncbi:MAG: hypothetical protein KGL39_59010 [Patescibacteria group bacterium]|nr:hypothetical protein [Patescibacteria group bacterium]
MTRDERNIAICAAYEAGASLSQVAERFGVTPERVRQVMLRCGHPLRSRSEGWQARLHADPEFARRHSERLKALNADPEFARRRETARERMTLTPEQRAVYALLRRKGCCRDEALVEARRPIRGEAAE